MEGCAVSVYLLSAMPICDVVIRNALLIDGTGGESRLADVGIMGDKIHAVGEPASVEASVIVDGENQALSPGFIDVHTHDDLEIIRNPGMLPKLSQGVTTVIAGNCGISAAPVRLTGNLPDPMNLLGDASEFQYPGFASYVAAIAAAEPALNIAALVGHTALRSNHLDRLDRAASELEIAAMRGQLEEALSQGAIGLSSGLAYLSAYSASTEEVAALAELLAPAGAVYTTHMRTEGDAIVEAMNEALAVGRLCQVPVILSHLKCYGIDNWGRSGEVLSLLDSARAGQPVGCDCYPYAASSSTLDLRQVDARVTITITWSTPHPEAGGQSLAMIARQWNVDQPEAARRLQPAGAIYHSMSEQDMQRILRHPATMIGSDGLPRDPLPHPRLWGTFPRVLGRYARDLGILSLTEAVHKMTGLPAARFGLEGRGLIREGCYADLVLFDPRTIEDTATFANPNSIAKGISAVWVNGTLTYADRVSTGKRAGRFLPRSPHPLRVP